MDRAAERALLQQRSRTGGARQRKSALEQLQRLDLIENVLQSSTPSRFDSALGKQLVQDWAWGNKGGMKSATEVQGLALLAYRDEQMLLQREGLDTDKGSNMIKALAALGSWVTLQAT